MLDIQTYKNDYAYECDTNALIAVVKWFNRDYQLMHSLSWNFGFSIDDDSILLGQRLSPGFEDDDLYNSLDQYHGIKTIVHRINGNDALNIIVENINLNYPAIIDIDSYFLPWDNFHYLRNHDAMGHTIIIKGINRSKRILYCFDMNTDHKTCELSYENFLNGYLNELRSFHIHDLPLLENYNDIVLHSVNLLFERDICGNVFERIELFRKEIASNLDFENEVGNVYIPEALLFLNLRLISQGRKRFSDSLRYIDIKNDNMNFEYFAQNLDKISIKWGSIISFLIKAAYAKVNSPIVKKVSDKILELRIYEEKIATELFEYVSSVKNYFHIYESSKKGVLENTNNVINVFPVDISAYCNNKGIGTTVDSNANFSGLKIPEYIIPDNILLNDSLVINNIKFKLPNTDGSNYDNISCDGKTINVPSLSCKEIYLLGCSETGNYTCEFIIYSTGGKPITINSGFTDWDDPPRFGETIAWTGKCMYSSSELSKNVRLFAQTLFLPAVVNVESIILPDCPNMHIFSISLGNY